MTPVLNRPNTLPEIPVPGTVGVREGVFVGNTMPSRIGVIVKVVLAVPAEVASMSGPVVAAAGTVATTDRAEAETIWTARPLRVRVSDSGAWKFPPTRVIAEPGDAGLGETLDMKGGADAPNAVLRL